MLFYVTLYNMLCYVIKHGILYNKLFLCYVMLRYITYVLLLLCYITCYFMLRSIPCYVMFVIKHVMFMFLVTLYNML